MIMTETSTPAIKTLEMLEMLDELGISIDDMSYQGQLAVYVPDTFAGNYLYASLSLRVLIKTIKDQLKDDLDHLWR